MSKFRGYFRTNIDFNDTELFPTDASAGDTALGVYQTADNTTRISIMFEAKVDPYSEEIEWEVKEGAEQHTIVSTLPNFTPFIGSHLNIYEPYGMGLYTKVFGYVDSGALGSWGVNKKVGNDEIEDASSIEFHDTFTGELVDITDSVEVLLCMLPVYIRSGDQILGVGSAVFVGVWRIMWYKMSLLQGTAPSIATDIDTVKTENELIIRGDTISYIVTIYNEEHGEESLNGSYQNGSTTYIIPYDYYNGDWEYIDIRESDGSLFYKMKNNIGEEINNLIQSIASLSTINLDQNGTIASKIPKTIVDTSEGLVKEIAYDDNSHSLEYTIVKPSDYTPTPIVISVEIPTATTSIDGLMTSDTFNDIATIKAGSGKWIGVNFADLAALANYAIPQAGVNQNDYTYVISDSNHGGVQTIYTVVPYVSGGTYVTNNGTLGIIYSRIDIVPTIIIATDMSIGAVLSSSVDGDVSVDDTGKMTVNGYTGIISRLNALESQYSALSSGKEDVYTDPSSGPLHGKTLSQALDYLNDVIQGLEAVIINHSE
jgi:hypothetical protein